MKANQARARTANAPAAGVDGAAAAGGEGGDITASPNSGRPLTVSHPVLRTLQQGGSYSRHMKIMMTRLLSKASVIVWIAGVACSPQQRNTISGPTAIAQPASRSIAVSGPADVTFPPRNEPFLFRTNLESKYRDGLRREATTSFVDIEGTIVWTQEYLRYRVNQCSHAEAVARVMRQIDGFGVQPVCGSTATTAFPPRNEPFDFRSQLELKYRDGLRRGPTTTFVDPEGDIVWTQEYLRYRLNACGHAEAESKVFAQIDDRSRIPPTCIVCTGPPGIAGFVGWAALGSGDLTVTWEPASGVVTAYLVELGTTRNASNVGVVEVDGSARSHTFRRLAPGDYFARVRAKNDCGVSAPSNEAQPRVR